MSGRRLLDAAALYKASRGVAIKHIALRRGELDRYARTSSLAKAVKSQTDRITLTVKAASVLAQRFNEPGPSDNVRNREPRAPRQPQDEKQDGSYSASTGIGGLDDGNGWKTGCQGEIPSSVAQTPPPVSYKDGEQRSPSVNTVQEEGVFSERPSTIDHDVWNSTAEMPVSSAVRQGSVRNVPDDEIDQDVFYSTASQNTLEDQQQALPEHQAGSQSEELPEEAYASIFQSRKVSQMLRQDTKQSSRHRDLSLPSAGRNPDETSKLAHEPDQISHSMRASIADQSDRGLSAANGQEGSSTSPRESTVQASQSTDTAFEEPSTEFEHATEGASDPAPIQAAYELQQSRVPSSRFGRLWQYGGLATSMAFGAVGESLRRAAGSNTEGGSLMLSEANMGRLVAKLSKMRGAALKLGQMMSFQDSKMLPKPIHDVLQRVQDSADYMPPSQRDRVLTSNLGSDWRSMFAEFNETPIAAASIGQVHSAVLASTGQRVAVKVQYPGVADSIDSDLSNLAILLTASRLLPKGLFLDKTIANARTELAWECDYVREAAMAKRFKSLLADEAEIYRVPAIIEEASGAQVLTAEFVEGIGVTKAQNSTQEQKDWIGTNILRLCLREITEFKFMQTDPNWTNFLFNASTKKLELLDFGASRDFPDKFILPYIKTLLAASRSDRDTVRRLSIELGYLTGTESKAMLNAHIDSVLTLAEPFADGAPDVYDFRDQTITDRVRGFIPVMVRERLAPPPEETYSIHRKLSGAFLLCARLGSRVRCKEIFKTAMDRAALS